MQDRFVRRVAGAAGALALAAMITACAAPYNREEGFSGSSTPPRPIAVSSQAGLGESGTTLPEHFVTRSTTPLREGPHDGFTVRSVLPPGTPVTTDGYVGGDWWQVESKYGTGWVYSRDLQPS